VRDRASYVLQQDKVRFVLTTPIRPDASPLAAEIADHVHRHGDGVRDLALWVDDARDALRQGGRARRGERARAARRARRARRGGARAIRTVRRHHPLARRAPELPGPFLPGFAP
jgi:4-hydroxyphenylpyruvate dioxygenase